MADYVESIGIVFSPLSWRTGMRRLFLLTLPVSVPLWLVLMMLVGILATLRLISRPIAFFWNAPPRPAYRDYYGYSHNVQRERLAKDPKIVDIGDKRAA